MINVSKSLVIAGFLDFYKWLKKNYKGDKYEYIHRRSEIIIL